MVLLARSLCACLPACLRARTCGIEVHTSAPIHPEAVIDYSRLLAAAILSYSAMQVFQELTLQLVLDSAALKAIGDAAAHAYREAYDEIVAASHPRLQASSTVTAPGRRNEH